METSNRALTTEKIYLREFRYNDWQSVHKYASLERVCRYQTWQMKFYMRIANI